MNVRASRIGDDEIARRTATDVRHSRKRCGPILDIPPLTFGVLANEWP